MQLKGLICPRVLRSCGLGPRQGHSRAVRLPLSEQERNKALFQCLPRMNFTKVALWGVKYVT